MSTRLTTASGRHVDLLAPRADDIDFGDIAEQLAKEARYNGATPDVFYSVAEHSCRGAQALLEGGSRQSAVGSRIEEEGLIYTSDCPLPTADCRLSAAYFLLHDGHEAYLKDDTTPKKRALDAVAAEFGAASGAVREAFARLVERFDQAIHEKAGLAWPPPEEVEAAVAAMDATMLSTEWRDLRPSHPWPAGYARAAPLPGPIIPWPWWRARAELLGLAYQLLPACQRVVHAPPWQARRRCAHPSSVASRGGYIGLSRGETS